MSNPQPAPPMLYDIILRWCDHPTVYVGVDAIVQIIEQHPGERDWVAALSFPVGQQRAMVTFKVNPGGPSVKQIGAITLRRLGGAMELIQNRIEKLRLADSLTAGSQYDTASGQHARWWAEDVSTNLKKLVVEVTWTGAGSIEHTQRGSAYLYKKE